MTRAAVGTSRYSVQRYLPSSCAMCPEEKSPSEEEEEEKEEEEGSG